LDFLLTKKDVSEADVRKGGRAWMSQAGGLLLTFVLVSVFWGLYAGREFSLISIKAPVYYQDIPKDLQLRKASAEEVEVQVSGRRGLMNSLDPQHVRAFLSLADIGAGEHDFPLKAENIVLAPGLEVKRITPSSITVEMERILEITVQVKVDLGGTPPEGYELDTMRVKPDAVRVRGPATVLAGVSSIRTRPIDLQALRVRDGQATVEAPLIMDSPSIELREFEKGQVQVSLRFRRVQAAEEGGAVRTYTVEKGDSLYEIGRRYGVSADELRKLNNLKSGQYIQPGQELQIPPP
jgi:hypothetical protein